MSRIGLETNTEEKVPMNTPRLMVSAKSWIAPPPRIVRLRAAIKVVAEVMIVRPSVWFTLRLMISANGAGLSSGCFWRFSRIRSYTMILSLSE